MRTIFRSALTILLGASLLLPTTSADQVGAMSPDGKLFLSATWTPLVDPRSPIPTDCLDLQCGTPYVSVGYVTIGVGGDTFGVTATSVTIRWGDGAVETFTGPQASSCFAAYDCPFSHIYEPRGTPYHVVVEATHSGGGAASTAGNAFLVCWTGSRTCGG